MLAIEGSITTAAAASHGLLLPALTLIEDDDCAGHDPPMHPLENVLRRLIEVAIDIHQLDGPVVISQKTPARVWVGGSLRCGAGKARSLEASDLRLLDSSDWRQRESRRQPVTYGNVSSKVPTW